MKVKEYNRQEAVKYAHIWAYSRNPKYYNYDDIGGDCTNYISQCIFEGSKIMNYYDIYGWYYRNANDKSPSWTGAKYLYNFLINNKKEGPYATKVKSNEILEGDIIQLSFDNIEFTHSLIVVQNINNNILVASHTNDADYKPVIEYTFKNIRYLHINGLRY